MSKLELKEEVQTDSKRAMGEISKDGDTERNLSRVLQPTGFNDPVNVEAFVTVHQYDIVLDVLVVNCTTETLHYPNQCASSRGLRGGCARHECGNRYNRGFTGSWRRCCVHRKCM